ncbi:MAG: hypothetical protein GY953_03605 [bacterium]|nr:hypothetical protein [bacterium]
MRHSTRRNGMTRRELVGGLGAFAVAAGLPARAAGTKPLRGIFPIVATPYTESKAVDYDDLRTEIGFLDRCGVHGMVWPQLASEYYKLTKKERFQGMEVIAEAHRGKKAALVFGVQGVNREEALEYVKQAERLGPDALIAIPPREAWTAGDFREYYRAIAQATERPIFMQTTGGSRKVVPKIELLLELMREFPHLSYIKEEVQPIVERMIELKKHPEAVKGVFSGGGGRGMMYEMRLGMDGTMPGSPYSDLYVQVWDAYQAGKHAKARDVFSKLLLMLNCDRQVAGTRQYIMKKRGVFKTTVSRLRDYKYTPEAIAEIEHNWAACRPLLRA